jgi:hypothetical protein
MTVESDISVMQTDWQFLTALPPERQGATVTAWLLGDQADRGRLAAAILTKIGTGGTGWLLNEALAPGTGTARRLKLLEVIARHRLPLDVDQWHSLLAAQRRFGAAVGKRIAQITLQRQVVSPGAG